jgi:hypothetical protein
MSFQKGEFQLNKHFTKTPKNENMKKLIKFMLKKMRKKSSGSQELATATEQRLRCD